MARDHALALGARTGEAVLRLYGWTRPTVSFGRNEPAKGLYSPGAARDRGIDWVRRPTGGRAVIHGNELTYSVVVPDTALGGARATYGMINEALARALASLGADVSVTSHGEALRPDAGPCFREPAAGEVVAQGRKLVGSAQARIGGALLQHGSIIISGDASALDELRDPAPWRASGVGDTGTGAGAVGRGSGIFERGSVAGVGVTPPHARLIDLVGGVGRDAVEDAVATVLPRELHGGADEDRADTLRPRELDEAERLEAERYGSETWTWRR